MTTRWYLRAAFAVALGCGLTAGLARAQAPAPPATPPPPTIADPTPWGVIEGWRHPATNDAVEPNTTKPPSRWQVCNRIRDCLYKHNFGCWSHHNAFLCSSWHSEKTFIFGSCREFFGEACVPKQQLGPNQLGQGTVPGCGPTKAGCAHCK